MERVALAVILHEGRIVVEQLREDVRPNYRGVPAVLPGGRIHENETAEDALKREVLTDIGIHIVIQAKIAEREHPLLPGSSITYFFCTLEGTKEIYSNNKKKVQHADWVDVSTAAVLMLTLFTQVLAFLIKQIYGTALSPGVTLPQLAWLSQDFEHFGKKIRAGELVAFPTETVYGLGANAFDPQAVAAIFRAKNRPADNPLIVHVPSIEGIAELTREVDVLSQKLLENFTPGPLTVLLQKNNRIPYIVTAGSTYVGMRIPAHQFALEFLFAAKVPVAAPSANKSGKPSATHHEHVLTAFGDEIPNVLAAGSTSFGVESTVVMPKNNEKVVIMRQGAVTKEMLQQKLPQYEVVIAEKEDAKNAPSPGVKYRHYAPNAEVKLLPILPKKQLIAFIKNELKRLQKLKESPMILCTTELAKALEVSGFVYELGSEKNLGEIARNLYDGLLACDAKRVTKILIQSFPENGLGRTIMERIRRAAEVAT